MRIRKNTLAGILVITCVFLTNACVSVKHNQNIQLPDRTRTQSTSPFHYWDYYPDIRVYYHITQRYYYYPVGGHWRKAKKLPPGWAINKKNRVRLKIVGKPYLKHASHQDKYSTEKMTGNKPGGHKPGKKKIIPYRGNSRNQQRYPGIHAKTHVPPNKPDHATKRGAEDKHQPPGHARSDKKVHPHPGDTPGRSHKGERHAKKPRIHQHKPGNDKRDNGRGKSTEKQAHGNKHHMKVSQQGKKDRRDSTVHSKADRTSKGNGKPDKSNTAGNERGKQAAQHTTKRRKSDQSGKKQQKQKGAKANGPAQAQEKQVSPISKGSKVSKKQRFVTEQY